MTLDKTTKDKSLDEGVYTVPKLTYLQVFTRFLRFGFLAWGGPVAQIAMIRRELVEEERWISSSRFNRLLAVYQILPGPEAHELCVFFGTLPRGKLGGFLAGLAFMLPGFLLMFALSWLYVEMDITKTLAGAIFLSMQPAVIALIVRAVHRIGGHVLLNRWLWVLGIVSALAALMRTPFWMTLPIAGFSYMLVSQKKTKWAYLLVSALMGISLYYAWIVHGGGFQNVVPAVQTLIVVKPTLFELFLSGLKAGLLTFGGAYTVIPFLRTDAVGRGWMTDAQFLDGLALSGILPAPLIIFSTFVGYFGGGPLGAIVMTTGIFLPAFSFSIFFHDQLEGLIENKKIRTFLEGVSAGVVGLITATTLDLGYKTFMNVPGIIFPVGIFVVSLAALYVFKAKTTILWVILGAALAGFLML